jgi:hypothetical protein
MDHPLMPTVESGRLLSQSQIPLPTPRITSRTSSPSEPLCTIIGRPASPPSLTWGTSGIWPTSSQLFAATEHQSLPSTGKFRSDDALRKFLGDPNNSCGVEHEEHLKCDMLSSRPAIYYQLGHCHVEQRTGISTFLNIATPFLASTRATSCGVETITAPFISIVMSRDVPSTATS